MEFERGAGKCAQQCGKNVYTLIASCEVFVYFFRNTPFK